MSSTDARRAALGCLALAVSLVAGAPARANELRVAGQTQAPNVLYSLTTTLAPGGDCDLDVEDTFWGFPPPLAVPPGSHRARILFSRRDRPVRLKVVAVGAVDEGSKPAGPRDVLDSRLSRAHAGGKAAGWRATFAVEPPSFLTVSTRWPGDRGCGFDDQSLVTYNIAAG